MRYKRANPATNVTKVKAEVWIFERRSMLLNVCTNKRMRQTIKAKTIQL